MNNHRRIAILVMAAGVFAASAAAADSNVLLYGSGVGSTPGSTVHGVAAGGAPWVIGKLKASIKPDGSVSVHGEGLLLSGGNNVGTRGGPRQVVASLFCRAAPIPPATAGAPIGPFNSPFVDLDADGDFDIKGQMTDATGAVPPVPCGDKVDNRPTLLIRTVTSGAPGSWFAAGILK